GHGRIKPLQGVIDPCVYLLVLCAPVVARHGRRRATRQGGRSEPQRYGRGQQKLSLVHGELLLLSIAQCVQGLYMVTVFYVSKAIRMMMGMGMPRKNNSNERMVGS